MEYMKFYKKTDELEALLDNAWELVNDEYDGIMIGGVGDCDFGVFIQFCIDVDGVRYAVNQSEDLEQDIITDGTPVTSIPYEVLEVANLARYYTADGKFRDIFDWTETAEFEE